tara:strand:+ start:4085 stop:4390 length:306 start_codon:yes stop_codon:yes gene_type:complete
MGKLADQITTDCCGSLLNDKAQLVRDVAFLEGKAERLSARVAMLTRRIIACNAERDILKSDPATYNKDTCRAVFNVMYHPADPSNKEKVWANLCLTLGIDA